MSNRYKKPSSSTASTTSKEEIKFWNIKFETDRMQLYHKARTSFFRKLRYLISFLSLLYSSSTIYSLLNNHSQILLVSSLVMTVLFIIDIVFDLAGKEAKHRELFGKYHFLLTEIEATDDQSNQKILNELGKKYKEVEREQPEILRALGIWVHNQIIFASGAERKYCYELNFWQKTFKNWLQFAHADFKQVG